jgi:hypothetical protein
MSARTELPKSKAGARFMSLHVVVKGKKEGDRQWKEVADLLTFSANGSSFNLRRECEVGTLVSLTIPLPSHLRCYDFDKEFYRVWGLVQHCEAITASKEGKRFHIGVAFIGKACPDGYAKNPLQHYRIEGVNQDGMWAVAETKTPFKKRSDVRFWKQINLYLALIDTHDGSTGGERTTAENVSRSGAAVFTTMNVNVGDRVKFISEEYDFSGLAVVCNLTAEGEGVSKLHLKFVQSTFPVKTLMKAGVQLEEI